MNPAANWSGVFDGDSLPAAFTTLDGEASEVGAAATKTPLADHGVVEVGGAEAGDFLHAQFSADLRRLTPGQSVLTAWCSPKGRVLFLPRVLRGDDAFRLLLPRESCAAFVARLRMFVLRAAVTVVDRSGELGAIRLDQAAPPAAPPDGVVAADGAQTWLLAPFAALAACWSALPASPVGANAAVLADVRLGRPRLDEGLTDRFLPQELNLDLAGGVSFEKGCYPGQEIVARVRFRGSVKRRLARFALAGAAPPAAGTRLADASGEARGTVLMAAMTGDDAAEVLAVLDREADAVTVADSAAALTRLALADDALGG